MKNTKNVIWALLLMLSALALCGCVRIEENLLMGEDVMIESTKLAYDKKEIDELYADAKSELPDMPVEIIDGKEYYIEAESQAISYTELMNATLCYVVSKEQYFYKSNELYDNADAPQDQTPTEDKTIDNVTITVTFTSPIQVTNGVLSADGYSATWSYDSPNLASTSPVLRYAYTGAEHIAEDTATLNRKIKIDSDYKKPVIKGVKNNKSYKGKSRTFYVKDNVGIKNIKLNGKKVKLNLIKKGKYKNYYKVTTKKQGKNKVIATDLNGNKKTLTFTLRK